MPIGGGGLAAGVAAYIKALRPDIKVIGVEPTGSNAMAMSLAKGRRVLLDRVDGFADGVAVKWVGAETMRLCREHLDGIVLVSNSEISAAIKDVFNETRSILEVTVTWCPDLPYRGMLSCGDLVRWSPLRLFISTRSIGNSTEAASPQTRLSHL